MYTSAEKELATLKFMVAINYPKGEELVRQAEVEAAKISDDKLQEGIATLNQMGLRLPA